MGYYEIDPNMDKIELDVSDLQTRNKITIGSWGALIKQFNSQGTRTWLALSFNPPVALSESTPKPYLWANLRFLGDLLGVSLTRFEINNSVFGPA